jgi:hypothetical protein
LTPSDVVELSVGRDADEGSKVYWLFKLLKVCCIPGETNDIEILEEGGAFHFLT